MQSFLPGQKQANDNIRRESQKKLVDLKEDTGHEAQCPDCLFPGYGTVVLPFFSRTCLFTPQL